MSTYLTNCSMKLGLGSTRVRRRFICWKASRKLRPWWLIIYARRHVAERETPVGWNIGETWLDDLHRKRKSRTERILALRHTSRSVSKRPVLKKKFWTQSSTETGPPSSQDLRFRKKIYPAASIRPVPLVCLPAWQWISTGWPFNTNPSIMDATGSK